jgi:hypothetical protein
MGKSEEGNVNVRELVRGVALQNAVSSTQVWVDYSERGPRFAVRPEIGRLELRVTVDQSDQFAPAVTGGAKYGCANHRSFWLRSRDYTHMHILCQRLSPRSGVGDGLIAP